MFSRWAATVLLGLSVSLAAGQSSKPSARIGTITGVVLDEQGQPEAQANVCVGATVKNQTANVCMTASDSEGRFQTEPLEAGNYRIFALKESDGYTNFDQGPGEPVTVSTSDPTPNVVIRLKPRAGMVIASVRDKITGKPIDSFTVDYLSVQKRASGGSSGAHEGTLSLALPTASDILLVVTAQGYRTWYYSDGDSPLLRLSSGEKRTLDIQLEPTKETASN